MAITKIAQVDVGVGGAVSIDFTSIPSTFTDLKIIASLRASNANTDGNITFNGLTTNLNSRQLYGTGSAAGSSTNASKILSYALADASSYASSVFSTVEINIANYTSSTNKSVSIDTVVENDIQAAFLSMVAGLWSSSSAITQVTLKADTGNLAQYSSATIYGISKTGATGATVA